MRENADTFDAVTKTGSGRVRPQKFLITAFSVASIKLYLVTTNGRLNVPSQFGILFK